MGRVVCAPIRILATLYNGRDLSIPGLWRLAMRLRPGSMRQLRPRISSGVFVQTPPFLPVLPPKARRRIRRMAFDRLSEKSPAQALGFQHTQTPPDLFRVRPLPARQTEQMRVERGERLFEIRTCTPSSPTAAFFPTAPSPAFRDSTPKTSRSPSSTKS